MHVYASLNLFKSRSYNSSDASLASNSAASAAAIASDAASDASNAASIASLAAPVRLTSASILACLSAAAVAFASAMIFKASASLASSDFRGIFYFFHRDSLSESLVSDKPGTVQLEGYAFLIQFTTLSIV